MVKILQKLPDPTLDAMDVAIGKKAKREKRRPYLGMSGIGQPCARQQWYGFHWVAEVTFEASTLKLFEDGHRTEDLYADRLRSVPGVTLIVADPVTGRQIGFEDFGGHFKGHMDGHIEGLLQAPVTPHVWEHKATNETKFNKLIKLGMDLGKGALKEWDFTYYVQGILYMDYGNYTRHYLTASTPGGRVDTSVRTNADPKEAQKQKDKAEKIIFDKSIPEKISDKPDYYLCRWCDNSDICHEGAASDRNCRTCTHSTARREGGWRCEYHGVDLTYDAQHEGCTSHRYNPHLVPGEVVDGDLGEGNWIEYLMPNGKKWKDG